MKTQINLDSKEVEILLKFINDELGRIYGYVRPTDIASQIKFGQLSLLYKSISEAKNNFENTPDANNIGFSKNWH